MTTMNASGQPRPTLASQLDRLESILEHLHETFQQTVAATVEPAVARVLQQAVSQTIQATVPLLLDALRGNTPLLPMLHEPRDTTAPRTPPVRALVLDACATRRTVWRRVRTAWTAWLGQTIEQNAFLAAVGQRLRRWRRRLVWACGSGLAASLLISWTGPWLGMTVGFLAGFLLTLIVPAWQRFPSSLSPRSDGA